MEPVLSRRSLLRAAGVAGLGVPLLAACSSTAPAPRPAGAPRTDPVSVAMHLHSSFSEGTASMATHLDQARRLGVDVLFWTDHDFRVSAQGYRRRLRLGAATDVEDGVALTWTPHGPGQVGYGDGAAELTGGAAGPFWLDADAWNSTYSGSIADTTLAVTVRPAAPAAGYAAVQLDLSYHPAGGGRPAGQHRLTYRIGATAGRDRTADGLEGRVDVPAPAGWSTVTLRPVEDIAGLWPDLVAGDNALHRLRVGVVGAGPAGFREVRIDRSRRGDSLGLMREVMAQYAQRHPDRRQYAALEVSLVRHLNWFGGELTMPDYGDRAPVKDDSVPAAAAMVELIHRHGGLASYNHPLGAGPQATAAHMVATKALGADILEVAYGGPSVVDGMLHVLDACARNLVLVTANGVTDDHSGTDWYGNGRSNWITRMWAGSAELPDLQEALRAGRAWAYKPDGWTGALRTTAGDRPAMGAVVATAARSVPVTVTATDLPRGGALEVVTGRADRAAPAPAVEAVTATGGARTADVAAGSYVRAVVRDAAGRIVGVGNPTWVVREHAGIPSERQLTV